MIYKLDSESEIILSLRISQLRKRAGESQQELADSIGVKRETVKFWESGERKLKGADIVKLAKHYKVSTDYLLGLSDYETPKLDIRAMCEYTGLTESSLFSLQVTSHLCKENCTGRSNSIADDFIAKFWHEINRALIELWNTTEKTQAFWDKLSPNESIESINLVKQELELSIYRASRICNKIPNIFLSDVLLGLLEGVYHEKLENLDSPEHN